MQVNAQFIGGKADGQESSLAITQILGEGFFTGGKRDGNQFTIAISKPLGEGFFTGGKRDGNEQSTSLSQTIGQNIYSGGFADGNQSIIADSNLLGEGFFTGGKRDGNQLTIANSKPLGEGFFTGGKGMGFAIAIVANTPLPIVMLSFSAEWSNTDGLLNWTTANDEKIEEYKIERSINGIDFEVIGKQIASKQKTKNIYSYTDPELSKTFPEIYTYYYRLTYTETNGKKGYSGIATLIRNNKNQLGVVIYPNPASEHINIDVSGITSTEDLCHIFLINIDGQLIADITGNSRNRLDISSLAKGTYLIVVKIGDNYLLKQRLVIQ